MQTSHKIAASDQGGLLELFAMARRTDDICQLLCDISKVTRGQMGVKVTSSFDFGMMGQERPSFRPTDSDS